MSKETEEAYQKGWAKGTRRILGDDANVYGIGREDMKEEVLKLIDLEWEKILEAKKQNEVAYVFKQILKLRLSEGERNG